MGEAPAASGSTGKDGTEDEGGGTSHEEGTRTFRPGAIIAQEGERCGFRLVVEAGVVEESLGVHLLGRRSVGAVVPTLANGRSTTTVRAITVVKARPTRD